MTLEFGTNLKRLRREKDLTQDELAEKLSLSPQAISRYETGAAYPDIEMLPVIAGFFGVTVDKLLGLSEEAKNRRMREYGDELMKLTDRRARLELLRREHAEFPEQWNVVSDMVYEMTFIPECLDEMRKTVADAVKRCDNILWRENMILFYIEAEPDEDAADDFINKNCSRYNMRKSNLLHHRWSCRGDSDRLTGIKQKLLRDDLVSALTRMSEDTADRADSKKRCRESLDFLCGISEKSDVTKPDMWVNTTLILLLQLADNCFALAEDEEGYAALENAVTLLENTFALPDNTLLTYGMPMLDRLSAHTRKRVYYHSTEFTQPEPDSMMMDLIYEKPVAQAGKPGEVVYDMERFYRTMLFSRHTADPVINAKGDGFARVKDDNRYRALAARLENVKKPDPELVARLEAEKKPIPEN